MNFDEWLQQEKERTTPKNNLRSLEYIDTLLDANSHVLAFNDAEIKILLKEREDALHRQKYKELNILKQMILDELKIKE